MMSRINSFKFALSGLKVFFLTQPNAWIHAVATIVVITLGLYCNIASYEWLAIIIVIGLVWMAETFNTAIEFTCDAISTEHHPLIKRAKDIAAGAVFLTAIISLIVAAIVFIPYFKIS